MQYKIHHGTDDDFVVYRKFHYSARSHGVKGFIAILFTSIGIYCLLPTPDEVITIPLLAKVYGKFFGITFKQGVVYGLITYKIVGITFIALAIFFGGRYVQETLKMKVKEHSKHFKIKF